MVSYHGCRIVSFLLKLISHFCPNGLLRILSAEIKVSLSFLYATKATSLAVALIPPSLLKHISTRRGLIFVWVISSVNKALWMYVEMCHCIVSGDFFLKRMINIVFHHRWDLHLYNSWEFGWFPEHCVLHQLVQSEGDLDFVQTSPFGIGISLFSNSLSVTISG